jgi:hypothetical protein
MTLKHHGIEKLSDQHIPPTSLLALCSHQPVNAVVNHNTNFWKDRPLVQLETLENV